RGRWSDGPGQGGDAGDVRRGHGGAVQRLITSARHRAQDAHSRRAQVHTGRTVIGEGGSGVGGVGGGHGDDIVQVVGRGVAGGRIMVGLVIVGGGDEEHPARAAGGDGVLQRRGVRAAAPAVTGKDDVHASVAHQRRIIDGSHGARGCPPAGGGE